MKSVAVAGLALLLIVLFFQCSPFATQEGPSIEEATEVVGPPPAPTEVLPAITQTAKVSVTPTVVLSPVPTKVVSPTPIDVVPPTPTIAPAAAPETEAEYWGDICQPSPKEEGQLVANLNMGTSVELQGYLYAKSFSMVREGMMPFTLREIPYGASGTDWSEACKIHLFIAIGSGPNHVIELPDKFEMGDVVVWDKTGREIRGWQRNLDSFHIRLVGVVVETYGEETGLGGSNTIRLEEIELLES